MNNHARTKENCKRLRLKSFVKRFIKPGKVFKAINVKLNNVFCRFKTSSGSGRGYSSKRNKFYYKVVEICKHTYWNNFERKFFKDGIVYYIKPKKQLLIGALIYIYGKPFRVKEKTINYGYRYRRFN